MAVMCDLIQDMEQRILSEAINLCKVHKRATLTAREIQTAARIVLPGELALHAVSEGTKSITKYNAGLVPRKMLTISSFNPSDQQELLTKDSMKQGEAVDSVAPEIEQIIKPEKKEQTTNISISLENDQNKPLDASHQSTQKPITRSRRAGLIFSVGAVSRHIKQAWKSRQSVSSATYLTAVIEYLAAEVLELALKQACSTTSLRTRVIPRDIFLAIKRDSELSLVLRDTIIKQGGALPLLEVGHSGEDDLTTN